MQLRLNPNLHDTNQRTIDSYFLFSLIASNYLYPVGHTWIECGGIQAGSPKGETQVAHWTQEENTDISLLISNKEIKLYF